MDVYHVDVYMPDTVYYSAVNVLCESGGRYRLSRHARERMVQKNVSLPERIPVGSCSIIEVTGIPMAKMLLRFTFGGKDVVMGLSKEGVVTTLYWNQCHDVHTTLDRSKYVPRP
jgi:hypothetical protein